MSDKFYPQLSNIVSLDSLPEQISFIEGGLQWELRDSNPRPSRCKRDALNHPNNYRES